MSSFWDDVKDTFSVAKQSAGKYAKIAINKTSNVVDITKLNISKSNTESKITKLYAKIGEIIYDEYLSGREFDGELGETMVEIDEFTAELTEIKDKIASLKEGINCPKCGEQNPIENEYCSKCGEKLDIEEDYYDDDEEYESVSDNYVVDVLDQDEE